MNERRRETGIPVSETSAHDEDRTPSSRAQQEDEETTPRKRTPIFAAVALLLALIALVTILALRTCVPSDATVPEDSGTNVDAEGSEWVKTPDVTGLEAADAEETIRAADLEPIRYEGFSQDVAAGFIVVQYPSFNVPVLSGDPVLLHVSVGNRTGGTIVPSVLRQSVENAKQTIRDAGLEPVLVPIHTGGSNAGALAGQIPSPGVRVPDGSKVGIVVVAESDGP